MNEHDFVLPAEGAVKLTQNPLKSYKIISRDRSFLLCTAAFCVLLADTFLWHSPSAGLTLAVFVWYVLVLAYIGTAALAIRSNQVLLLFNLFLALTLALGSNTFFRLWNCLALLVLLPVHALGLSGGITLPWWKPVMLWERFCLLLWGLFGNLGASLAAAATGRNQTNKRTLPLILGAVGAAALTAILLPVLASADALFAVVTASLQNFIQRRFSTALQKLLIGLVMTPFLFGFLYTLRRPASLKKPPAKDRVLFVDGLVFVLIAAALDALYLLFLAVQSTGLFGGPEYLAQQGISYAEWARSGFFQMVSVTVINLTVILTALSFSRRDGKTWKSMRILTTLLVLESLILLVSAAWRMTLYVSAYGLSFKRCMTYWGMVMIALFLLTALRKTQKPDFSFCRAAFPLALAGWLVINCVPVDYLVAKSQVDRYLSNESDSISVEYLVRLSYDTLAQLERLSGKSVWSDYSGDIAVDTILSVQQENAARDCSNWRTWSLSACLAAGG